ncbi:MAG: hypothetical protein ACJARD_000221 [Alphaproteobacteria bacterium]|jgi:hypothetical protein
MSSIYFKSSALPLAQQLESTTAIALQNSRFQGIRSDIDRAQSNNQFQITKDLVEDFSYNDNASD